MFCWVAVDVMQPRQIRFLERDMAVPKLKPHLAPRRRVLPVEFLRRLHVQLADEFAQRLRLGGRSRDEMVMVGQHRPRSQRLLKLGGVLKQRFQEKIPARG